MQVTRSVETVLQDVKAMFDAANQQALAAGQDAKKYTSDVDMIKAAIEQLLDQVRQLCRSAPCPHACCAARCQSDVSSLVYSKSSAANLRIP